MQGTRVNQGPIRVKIKKKIIKRKAELIDITQIIDNFVNLKARKVKFNLL